MRALADRRRDRDGNPVLQLADALPETYADGTPVAVNPITYGLRFLAPLVPVPRRLDELADGVVARSRVEHGRWIVDCPSAFCRGAVYADERDPRLLCPDCGNEHVDGRSIAVAWPAPEEVDRAEELLLARSRARNRNWFPGAETVADLEAENEQLDERGRVRDERPLPPSRAGARGR